MLGILIPTPSCMGSPIPIELVHPGEIAIDGEVVALALGLEVAAFRQLMEDRKISVLCERGTGEDAGLYRATFYYGQLRARLVVDEAGRIVDSISG